jgi:hypothetical protein
MVIAGVLLRSPGSSEQRDAGCNDLRAAQAAHVIATEYPGSPGRQLPLAWRAIFLRAKADPKAIVLLAALIAIIGLGGFIPTAVLAARRRRRRPPRHPH